LPKADDETRTGTTSVLVPNAPTFVGDTYVRETRIGNRKTTVPFSHRRKSATVAMADFPRGAMADDTKI
jgi:hypothetical protein